MAGGTIRYWAAAKAAAGTAEEAYDAATLAEALDAARARHADRPDFARVLDRCSLLVDGQQVGSRPHGTVELPDGGMVEVLPPFAGGSGTAIAAAAAARPRRVR
ncbi:MoaD/ThiS family protein [Streptomyces sp. B6B3]|uniref:MoaD/ThiS family protein n=1 Tax=Streptomyces sp. B6B3 TaxID=3153570 RepID=UPI00325F89EB